MLTRKRKRNETSPPPEHESDAGGDDDGTQNEQQSVADLSQKEVEIWDAVKEEYHEAIEQLPLTLHRQYALLKELDQQVSGHQESLLSLLSTYVATRQEIALQSSKKPANSDACTDPLAEQVQVSVLGDLRPHDAFGPVEPRQTNPSGAGEAKSTRQMLTRIACTADDMIRASEEKVNVARAVHESVDRHVRMLEIAIREQESSITFGTDPSHMRPSLPDLSALRASRPTRTTLTPIEDEDVEEEEQPMGNKDGDLAASAEVGDKPKKGKSKGKTGRSKQETSAGKEVSLTITVPPLSVVAEPDEATYCYCNQVSFGEMIACDSKKCEREWFHLKCAGLEVSPEDGAPWYCRDCRPVPRRKRK